MTISSMKEAMSEMTYCIERLMYCLETLQERGNIGSIHHNKGNGDLKKMVGGYPP